MEKPQISTATMVNMSVANVGTAIGFALQQGNMSRIFQTLGADLDALPMLMIAGPVTGLIIQPLVGHFSDRNWGRFGRRRPFIFGGALFASLALLGMPHAKTLLVAAILLWLLDAALNVAIEPFRVFMADMTPQSQRTKAIAFNSALGCIGAIIGFFLPWGFAKLNIANTAPAGQLPPSVQLALAVAAVLMFVCICWTVFTTREYGREVFERFEGDVALRNDAPLVRPTRGFFWLSIGVGLSLLVWRLNVNLQLYILTFGLIGFGALQLINQRSTKHSFIAHILSDLHQMPTTMKRLAWVQFFTWSALFIMWTYMTPVITQYAFGAREVGTSAYNVGADWTNILYVLFNLASTIFGLLVLPQVAKRLGDGKTHGICLFIGSLSYLLFFLIRDPWLLFFPFIGLGIAWASILTIPYALLTCALPPQKFGVYLGIFNFFITLPQIVSAALIGPLLRSLFPSDPIWTLAIASGLMMAAALLMLWGVRKRWFVAFLQQS